MAIQLMKLFATDHIDKYVNPACPSSVTKSFNHSVRIVLYCRNVIPLVNLIALYYQIRDDYMNLQSDEVSTLCICLLVARRLDHRDTTMQVQINERLR